jgi:hypothetical protein
VFKLNKSDGAAKVKLFDYQIANGTTIRKRAKCGHPSKFTPVVEARCEKAFAGCDTATYEEAAVKAKLPTSTFWRFMTKLLDFRCTRSARRSASCTSRSRRATAASASSCRSTPLAATGRLAATGTSRRSPP